MQKLAVELSEKQVEQLVDQLPMSAKLHLVRRLEHQMWPQRLQQLLSEIRVRVRQNPRLTKEALQSIEPARRAFYAARRGRH